MISSPARVAAGSIIVEPRRLVEKTRSAAEWRRGEREADEDIRLGRVSKVFSDPDKLISELRKK